MKKSVIVISALISTLIAVGAACGSSSDTMEESVATASNEGGEMVVVTPPPAEEEDAAPAITAEPEATPYTTDEQDGEEDEDVPEDLVTAQDMIGQSVSELYAAIGEPESSAYTESCLVEDGNDGLLYYDGFIVSTIRYADGTEVVLGAY